MPSATAAAVRSGDVIAVSGTTLGTYEMFPINDAAIEPPNEDDPVVPADPADAEQPERGNPDQQQGEVDIINSRLQMPSESRWVGGSSPLSSERF